MITELNQFVHRYPRVGPWLWIASLQYFIVQMIVASRFDSHFSLAHNTISDLGNTACGLYGDRVVCSPSHNLMNLSFILLGVGMAAGAVINYHALARRNRTLALGFGCLVVAGIGTILIGLAPENTISELHILGAAMPLLIGNIGLLVLGLHLPVPTALRRYTLCSGVVALLALSLFVMQFDSVLGNGGLERLAAYPQTIWLIVYGVYHLQQRPPISRDVRC